MIVWDPNKAIDIEEYSNCEDGQLERYYCISLPGTMDDAIAFIKSGAIQSFSTCSSWSYKACDGEERVGRGVSQV